MTVSEEVTTRMATDRAGSSTDDGIPGRQERAPRRRLLGFLDSPVASYYLLVGLTSLLVLIGLGMVLSASSVKSLQRGDSAYEIFLGQAQYAVFGTIALVAASLMRPAFYKRVSWPFLVAAIGMQLLIFTPLARSKGGNTGWIYLGGFTVQPAEIAKLALAIWLGTVLARKARLLHQWSHVLMPAVPVVGIVVGLVLAGHDLGTAIILLMVVAGALWIAGVPGRMFLAGGAVMAVGVWALVAFQGNSNRLGRIDSWLNASCNPDVATCYQFIHGKWALASGGLSGVGLGAGSEKWLYLPEAHNDFIFAVIGEELGLQGTVLMLVLFGALGYAMSRVVVRHPDPAVKVTTGAICCWIVGQALVNIGVVIGALPVIGVPLPLVSAGGSALIMTMAALGVVISFARDEPGAREALAARSGTVRRSLAVVGGSVRRRRKDA